MVSSQVVTFDEMMSEVKKYIKKEENIDLITRAYLCAEKNHTGQYRKSGEPYIIHAIQVGYILSLLRTGPRTIAAGLLHDVVEDCDVTLEEITEMFGNEVASLVDSVTKIGNLKFKDEKEYLASNHRKIFIAMAKDVRVILIKLADRLHNMRTLQYMTPEKQKKIAAETLDVYAPIAHRLGISDIKNELEDLSFQYLNKEKYYEIARLVEKRKAERDEQVQRMIKEISDLLDDHHIQYRIFGRSKHLYSIYKKMKTKNKRFEEILDLLAIRIITDSDTACYEILGYIHAKYRPIPGRFKDYIAMPKMNMYQSLHSTIVADDGNIFEIQIRTESMDEVAEQGIAAHWRYKENMNGGREVNQSEIEEQLHWLKDFSVMSDDVNDDSMEYMNLLQKDIFEANVYCMTPKGKVIALPNGSTPIDFAYRVHTEVGHHTVGATINGVLLPLNTKLKTGDVVSIRTSKQSPGPSEDWIKIVKSAHARNKIRSFFQKQENERRNLDIKKGEEMLQDELKKRNLDVETYTDQKKVESIAGSLSFNSYQDLMFAIGVKQVSLPAVIDRLVKHKTSVPIDNEELQRMFNRQDRKRKVSSTGIRVAGIDSMKITLANCCSPVPGDDIVGYITKGAGVKVHRSDCPNVINEKKRLIAVEWDENLEQKTYEVKLIIHSSDRNYLLSDIVTVVSQCKAGLQHVDSTVDEDQISATTKMTVVVENAEHLHTLMANLRKINSVRTVERVIQ
ncbi:MULTISPECIES: RelA/SpoT family protein [Bacillota]|uniref:GTP diphosphokinase n=2 Tax=Amedibacillus TaxID=2749846 RepID=A0A7G9GM30_9FIRM|nr:MULTISPECIES: bifunctional (p)ppGpp synthetase/guanosine-3',5'-bis(diphosphate) 3'-pyrophosphohydrolase [Bacillota]QNM11862.1 bifunctional (p)ppGpp synthetase/guanosine-3',5'-bis(diphosphate) 3'-pyrophosphohydrolase [[Eubacterium] hominis]MCH4287215.1 bifunctional (p)ppGpp synthetase/guanosine-3',5'-bis(diphosphate) 3'-pyrophosphohydrolase [Amedibacillus hominis]RGB50629.1 bifunctional (p)ppGpp synthetase/guanosine-3',5'-bis(diphosphate) 3'-pyrophosphohydrolase [Absiella sp. AM22-9]RGB62906.